jgi:uncharacterized protein YjbI with pentapeptide repeats
MMNSDSEIALSKPSAFRLRPVKVDGKELFKAIGKGGLDVALGKWDSLGTDIIDGLTSLGLAKKPEEIAWMLVYRSLVQAMFDLMASNRELLLECPESTKDLSEWSGYLDEALEKTDLKIGADFFRSPGQLPILEELKAPFRRWLEAFGLSSTQAKSMSLRLPTYFVFALHKEWQKNRATYEQLQKEANSPFTEAMKGELDWQRYRAWLQKQVEEPMFLEAFGLKQVYVPLNCFYFKKAEERQERDLDYRGNRQKTPRIVGQLGQALQAWLEQADREDAIRVICGGPGCGKSSFTKIWAAQLAEAGEIPVLFIPLHQFDPESDLVEAIGRFIDNDLNRVLPPNPLNPKNVQKRLLVIFDGLDELAMQGKVGSEVAQQFVREVQKHVDRFNQGKLQLQVLLSGRDVVVQANSSEFRKEGQILHVLPYLTSKTKEDIDPENLLDIDLRNQWWQNYGVVSGRGYAELPTALGQKNLVEITAQPLLNYLVALSYGRDKLNISETSNLNEIYKDLLDAIYDRGWADKRQHPTLRGVEFRDFVRVLEEVALAAWHGDGRTTTVREIEAHCDSSGLKQLLEIFQEGAKSGVTRLLTAFYFRQSGGVRDAEKTFEFTHKSFGEYLTACRIVRGMKRIHNELERRREDLDSGWDERQALKHWAELCGPSVMDEYMFRFLCDEIRLCQIEQVRQWQKTFCHLIEVMLRQGMPMETLSIKTYHEQSRQARNVEESLLVGLNACARLTNELSHINWPTPEAFGTWISRLQGQRIINKNPLAFSCLGWLDLEGVTLICRDLDKANMYRVNLQGANLGKANMYEAHMYEAHLSEANLSGANLSEANLSRANLSGANLRMADLSAADLSMANLSAADLYGVNLYMVNLSGADLSQTNLSVTDLSYANLDAANLDAANLDWVCLNEATLHNISWDEQTTWQNAQGLDTAIGVPEEWLKAYQKNSIQDSGDNNGPTDI